VVVGFQTSFLVVSVDLEVDLDEVDLDEVDNHRQQAFVLILIMLDMITQVREGLLRMKLNLMSFHFQDCHANRQANAGTGGLGNFFTGAALGALGGYAFGGRNRG
jgi:hypothetical protein